MLNSGSDSDTDKFIRFSTYIQKKKHEQEELQKNRIFLHRLKVAVETTSQKKYIIM